VTTRGCRDLLLFREGGRADPFDRTSPTPPPYVPRYLTVEVDERVAAGARC
jgi:N-methylhydantoinase A